MVKFHAVARGLSSAVIGDTQWTGSNSEQASNDDDGASPGTAREAAVGFVVKANRFDRSGKVGASDELRLRSGPIFLPSILGPTTPDAPRPRSFLRSLRSLRSKSDLRPSVYRCSPFLLQQQWIAILDSKSV